MKTRLWFLGSVLVTSCVLSHQAMANDHAKAPEYFVTAVVATSTAQSLARSCPTLSLNPAAVASATDVVLRRLEEDGLDPTQNGAWQREANRHIKQLQDGFVAKHGLSEPTEMAVCAAGHAEILEDSEIGKYLLNVSE